MVSAYLQAAFRKAQYSCRHDNQHMILKVICDIEHLVHIFSLFPARQMITLFPFDGAAERVHFAVLSNQIIFADHENQTMTHLSRQLHNFLFIIF